MIYFFGKYILGPFILLFWRPRVFGGKHLKVKGPAIFIANHLSMADPLLIALLSPRVVHFMAKKEIFQNPIGRWFFRSLFAFPIDRKTADLASLRNAMEVLRQGKVFGIFPEGKRSITYDLDELEHGAAFLALRSGAPLVPIYIHPSSYRSCRPKVYIGEPLNPAAIVEGVSKLEQVGVLTAAMEAALLENRDKLEAALCR